MDRAWLHRLITKWANKKQKEDELNNNTAPNDDKGKPNMQNQMKPDVVPQIPEKKVESDAKLEPVDLTTQPNTKECKTVIFKTAWCYSL